MQLPQYDIFLNGYCRQNISSKENKVMVSDDLINLIKIYHCDFNMVALYKTLRNKQKLFSNNFFIGSEEFNLTIDCNYKLELKKKYCNLNCPKNPEFKFVCNISGNAMKNDCRNKKLQLGPNMSNMVTLYDPKKQTNISCMNGIFSLMGFKNNKHNNNNDKIKKLDDIIYKLEITQFKINNEEKIKSNATFTVHTQSVHL